MNISYAQLKSLIREIIRESVSPNGNEWDVSKHSSNATQLYMLMKDFVNMGGTPNPKVVLSLTNAITQVKSPVERQELGILLQKYFPSAKPGKVNEALSEKNTKLIKKWCDEHGYREAAVKLIDAILSKLLMGMVSADLTDSATFANGLDGIETLLEDGNYEQALRLAAETAREMVAEEGGGGLIEGDEADAVNDMWSGSDDELNSYEEPKKSHSNQVGEFFPDFKKFQQFKKAYEKAVRENKPSFTFEGDSIQVDYAKYVIEFIRNKSRKPVRE
jgi:hypothetical protein